MEQKIMQQIGHVSLACFSHIILEIYIYSSSFKWL